MRSFDNEDIHEEVICKHTCKMIKRYSVPSVYSIEIV